MFKKKLFEPEKVTVKKYKAIFTTIDNIRHEGYTYNWAIANKLACSIPEFIMIDIKSDGYIEDKDGTMFMLKNVLSIEWELVDKATVKDIFERYKVFITNTEFQEAQ